MHMMLFPNTPAENHRNLEQWLSSKQREIQYQEVKEPEKGKKIFQVIIIESIYWKNDPDSDRTWLWALLGSERTASDNAATATASSVEALTNAMHLSNSLTQISAGTGGTPAETGKGKNQKDIEQ